MKNKIYKWKVGFEPPIWRQRRILEAQEKAKQEESLKNKVIKW